MHDLKPIADMMNKFTSIAGVRWDRCSPSEGHELVFGWIYRDDSKSDFVAIYWEGGLRSAFVTGFVTSSAKFTREFSKAIFGTEAGHNDCKRVEDVFGDLVPNSIKQCERP